MNVKRLLEETEKQRRVPGIIFVDGAAGRRARIACTGIEVFEVIRTYRAIGEDRPQLSETYDWLSEKQLEAALAYYEAYPEEIDKWLRAGERLERRCNGASSGTR